MAKRAASPFSQRLRLVMRAADMTVSDLALWFERPRSTINTWVNGRQPMGPSGRLAVTRLDVLERTIRGRKGLPVPPELSGTERPSYVEATRNAAVKNNRVPPLHFTG